MRDSEMMEVQDVMGKLDEGACWGNWSVSEQSCLGCVIMAKCSEATKKRQSGAAGVGPTEPLKPKGQVEDLPDTDPLEYMLQNLSGCYDRKTKDNKGVTVDVFSKEGTPIIMIAQGKDGSIRMKSAEGEKVVEKMESIEQVEGILSELLKK